MKVLITLIILVASSWQASGQYNNYVTQDSLERLILADPDLANDYIKAQSRISTGRVLGVISLISIGLTAIGLSSSDDLYTTLAVGALGILVASISGTIGTIFHLNGRSTKSKILDYARSNMVYEEHHSQNLELAITDNGVGLLLKF